jgi:DNA (cytosine-5)-methyltransferase 1
VDEKYYLDLENKYSRLIMAKRNIEDPYQIYQLRKFEVRLAAKGMCPTLTANMGHGGHNVPFIISNKRVRKLTERECLNIQGFNNNFSFPDSVSSMSKYAMIGNAVSPPVSKLIADRVLKLLKENHV